MAERRSAVVAPSAPAQAACRRGGVVVAPQAVSRQHRCICGGGGDGGGCGLGLARLVERLRRQGSRRRALSSAPAAARRRGGCQQCQYDPLSYARNFDLGGDDDAARDVYSFSSRFVLAAAPSSSSAAASAPSRPVSASH